MDKPEANWPLRLKCCNCWKILLQYLCKHSVWVLDTEVYAEVSIAEVYAEVYAIPYVETREKNKQTGHHFAFK